MVAHPDEPDKAFCYQTSGKPLSRAEQLSDLGHGQMALNANAPLSCHHATRPVTETSASRASRARRLALGERLFPVEPVGDGMQQPSAGRHVVLVTGLHGFPP